MAIQVEGISRLYEANQVQALDEADLNLLRGEVHALVGENGAGKSTLARILAGLERPDSGRIILDGADVTGQSSAEARRRGVRYVAQYPQFAENLSVWQNLILGNEPTWGAFVDANRAKERLARCGDRYGISADLEADPRSLTSGERHFAALIAAVQDEPTTVILDEPTAVLTDEESHTLYQMIRRLADEGRTVLLITHKLSELRRIADRLTVLRKGRTVEHLDAPFPTESVLSTLIFGEESALVRSDSRLLEETAPPRRDVEPVLRFDKLNSEAFRGLSLRDLTFSVYPGEFLAITGIRENGLETFEALLTGRVAATSGSVVLLGRRVERINPKTLRSAGVAYVPTDRLGSGASLYSTVAENLIIRERRKFYRFGILQRRQVAQTTARARERFRIEGASGDELRRLSGGNIQKVILAREMRGTPSLIFVAEPSWGLDLRSRHQLYLELRELRRRGSAVVLITTDLDEVESLADRAVVLYRGEIIAEYAGQEMRRDLLGQAMIGAGGEQTGPQKRKEPTDDEG
ncbi:MAG: ABC transporter ATP-binding protein [Alkalispirochaetaceae bacterium]